MAGVDPRYDEGRKGQEMTTDIEQGEVFAIEIKFESHSPHPSRIFTAMARLIDGIGVVDDDLVSSLDVKIESELLLEDIQIASLKSVLRNALRTTDDDALKNLNWKRLVGEYLFRAKHKMLEWLSEKPTISNREEIAVLGRELHQLAEGTDIQRFPYYRPVPLPRILHDIQTLTSAVACLNPNDSALFLALGKTCPINTRFDFDAEVVEGMMTKEKITNRTREILKVKKPDYLGDSMWDLRQGDRVIRAKIEDHDWLGKFQRRQEDVRPGDSLRCEMETTVHYGFDGEEVAVHYRVLQVGEVLPGVVDSQLMLKP